MIKKNLAKYFQRESFSKGSNMNLNEQCLLNFLQNPDSLNALTNLLCEYFNKSVQDFQQNEYNYICVAND